MSNFRTRFLKHLKAKHASYTHLAVELLHQDWEPEISEYLSGQLEFCELHAKHKPNVPEEFLRAVREAQSAGLYVVVFEGAILKAENVPDNFAELREQSFFERMRELISDAKNNVLFIGGSAHIAVRENQSAGEWTSWMERLLRAGALKREQALRIAELNKQTWSGAIKNRSKDAPPEGEYLTNSSYGKIADESFCVGGNQYTPSINLRPKDFDACILYNFYGMTAN